MPEHACGFQRRKQVYNCFLSYTKSCQDSSCVILYSTYRGGVMNKAELASVCDDSPLNPDSPCYEENIFKKRGLDIIAKHDASIPLFYMHSFHLVHTPLNVPQYYLAAADKRIEPRKVCRRKIELDNILLKNVCIFSNLNVCIV